MASKYPEFELKECKTAEDLWKLLCPTNELFEAPCRLIYRGVFDRAPNGDPISLVPSVLRKDQQERLQLSCLKNEKADNVVFNEDRQLQYFCNCCDASGLQIPGDSPEFREKVLSPQNMERYFYGEKLWPGEELDVVIAMAQHHGVPTRFLDWTRIPFVAAYFAASCSLAMYKKWNPADKLAVWVLNRESIGLYQDKVRIAEVPGGVSPHLSAQSGLFTVLLHDGTRGKTTVEPQSLESICGSLPNTPLMKITLPVEESVKLMVLCKKAGYNGARLFPTLDGAGRAVQDNINEKVASQKIQEWDDPETDAVEDDHDPLDLCMTGDI